MKLIIDIPEEDYEFCRKIAWRYRPLSREFIIAHGIPLSHEPCDDCISRAYIEPIVEELENICINANEYVLDMLSNIKNAPLVKPTEKVGHWVTTDSPLGKCCVCSECGSCPPIEYRFCPYCGAKMQEVEE